MRVSLAVIPLMLLIFSTDFSRRSSELSALKAASISNAPGTTCASAKFGKGLGWLVGSQLDNKVESSRNRRSGFDVGNALNLGNNVCTFSFAFGEYVACLIVSCHFFLP